MELEALPPPVTWCGTIGVQEELIWATQAQAGDHGLKPGG